MVRISLERYKVLRDDVQLPPWTKTHSCPATTFGGSTRPRRFGWYKHCAAVQRLGSEISDSFPQAMMGCPPGADCRGLLMCQRLRRDNPGEHRRSLDIFCVSTAIDERTAHHEACDMRSYVYGHILAALYDIPGPVAAQNGPSMLHYVND